MVRPEGGSELEAGSARLGVREVSAVDVDQVDVC